MVAASPRPPAVVSSRERVLIVDGAPTSSWSGPFTQYLDERRVPRTDAPRSNAIEVRTASRGREEALSIAATGGFDVAIVDVKLPDMSGVDLIPKLRSHCPFGEVVLMTGFATMGLCGDRRCCGRGGPMPSCSNRSGPKSSSRPSNRRWRKGVSLASVKSSNGATVRSSS